MLLPSYLLFCADDEGPPLTGSPPGPDDAIVWVATDTIEHTRDYYSFAGFVNPEFPTNWLWPVDYSEGRFTLSVDLIQENDPTARPIYYSVGWRNANDTRFTRVTVFMNSGPGNYQWTDYVKNAENVVNGQSVGSIGDDWTWTNAWQNVAGDAWGSSASVYPFKVKVTLTFHGW